MGSPSEDVAEILVSEEQLRDSVQRIAAEVTEEYAGKSPLIVGVLVGAFVFMADLVRVLDFELEVQFMAASSYGEGTEAGVLEITRDLPEEIAGRHILLVDDLLDTGHTLSRLSELLMARGAASVKTCCILDKPSRREVPFEADFVGLEIPDQFVVGYGLDYAHSYRNLPYVGVLRSELYTS